MKPCTVLLKACIKDCTKALQRTSNLHILPALQKVPDGQNTCSDAPLRAFPDKSCRSTVCRHTWYYAKVRTPCRCLNTQARSSSRMPEVLMTGRQSLGCLMHKIAQQCPA